MSNDEALTLTAMAEESRARPRKTSRRVERDKAFWAREAYRLQQELDAAKRDLARLREAERLAVGDRNAHGIRMLMLGMVTGAGVMFLSCLAAGM